MAGGVVGQSYSVNPSDYKLLEEVGYGASAVVYRAIYLPFNEVVAVKCLDLDRCNANLDDIRREAQTMSLLDHPNVISANCSFVVGHNLWMVMPFMAEGSCLHLMKVAYPDGFEELSIASILKETLKALEYFHRHGLIHRDVKAGNILLGSNGEVRLADVGVSASMFDSGDRQRSRNTFVGTPCWMAPEVLQPGTGYDFKADIWSFGITALELAHGHAPFSKYPPMKVLLMTIQNAPPGLDYDRDKKFSKSFKEMVAMCLVKDQTKRPTAEKLLKHSFFRNAKPPELSVKKLFSELPPLRDRVKALQLKDASQLALRKMPSSQREAISQSEYQRGVSAWNFDIEDLKFQASQVQEEDEIHEIKEEEEKCCMNDKDKSTSGPFGGKSGPTNNTISRDQVSASEVPQDESQMKKGKQMKNGKVLENDALDSNCHCKIGLEKSGSKTELSLAISESISGQAKTRTPIGRRQTQSGPLLPGGIPSHSTSEREHNLDRSELENQLPPENGQQIRKAPSFSGPLMLPNKASGNSLSAPIKTSGGFRDNLEDKSKPSLVKMKGRFSVTSENVDLVKDIPLCTVSRPSSQGSSLRRSASVGDWMCESKSTPTGPSSDEVGASNMSATVLMPHLQNLFQQTSIQQDLITNLLNSLQPPEVAEALQKVKLPPLPRSSESIGSVDSGALERERLLTSMISELQARMINLTEELNAEKLKYMQLQERLNAVSAREVNRMRRYRES